MLSLLAISPLYAAKVGVLLNDPNFSVAPAGDLTYQNEQIDSATAMELKNNGIDLSTLNPRESRLWKDQSLSASNQNVLNYPDQSETLSFKEFKSSPSEIFRSVVELNDSKFTLTASLDNHTNILRAALLRQLGYDLDVPKYYKALKIKFSSKKERKKFIDMVGESTLTKRERWIVEEVGNDILVVKGFTLEPAKLRNVNIYLPLMSRSRQQERRIFRALLNVYILTDFPQSINLIAWERGREFNNSLIFNHPYAGEFRDVTLEDMQWVQRRLAYLSRAQLEDSVNLMGLPQDISALLTEKLISRINNLSIRLRLPMLVHETPKTFLTTGAVVNGKLVENKYQAGYVVDFYKEDLDSPYRFSQLFRLFRTQIVYSSISKLMDLAITKFVPGLRVSDAIENIQEEIKEYRQNNPTQNGIMPIKAFTKPIANGRVFANRNVVFGQYLASNSPIQLVDSIGGEVSLGGYSTISGLAQKVMPNVGATVSLGRTYTHVRAMPDLKTATSQKIKSIIVPSHFKSLAKIIKEEYSCSIPEEPYQETVMISGEEVLYIKYDKSWDNGRERAIDLRQKLIDEGETRSILLSIIDREKLCLDTVIAQRNKSLEEFIKQFALNEMFLISDTIRVAANTNVPIPLTPMLGPASFNLNLSGDASLAFIRSVIVRKTEQGLELTIQKQKDNKRSFSEGISYFVELLSNTNLRTRGNLESKVYKINLENLNDNDTEHALRMLRALFGRNDSTEIENTLEPINLDHDVLAKLRTFRLLFFKSESLKMDHELEVIIPNRPGENYSVKQRTRNLFAVSAFKRKGNDFFGFMDRFIANLTGFLGLGNPNNDPGKNILGSSKKTYVSTEADLTPGWALKPVTRVEFIWSGWNKKAKKLKKIFDEVEALFVGVKSAPILDRSLLLGFDKLKSYDVRTSIIVYPEAIDKFVSIIRHSDKLQSLNQLRFAYGVKRWDEYCKRANEFYHNTKPHLMIISKDMGVCVPPSVFKIMRLAKSSMKDSTEKVRLRNKLAQLLFSKFNPGRVLQMAGTKNFFTTTRVSGFKEGSPVGQIEHISNSLGTYNTKYGTGVYDDVASKLGVSPFELRAMSYTPTM